MITLFVVQSAADAKDTWQTIDSFDDMASEVHEVASLSEINSTDRVNDWYAVIYDDEHVNEELLEGLKVFADHTDADVLILFRLKDDKLFRSPRLFRRHITLREDCLMPEQEGIKFETVLNGWILSNDQD